MSVETLNLRVSRIQKSQEIRRSLAHPPACGACLHGDICETRNIFQLCPRPAHCQLASQIDQLKRITPKITVSVFHYICFWWYTTFRAGKKNKMLTSTLGSKGGIFHMPLANCQSSTVVHFDFENRQYPKQHLNCIWAGQVLFQLVSVLIKFPSCFQGLLMLLLMCI